MNRSEVVRIESAAGERLFGALGDGECLERFEFPGICDPCEVSQDLRAFCPVRILVGEVAFEGQRLSP